jgi:acetyl-CoA carboxylase alpha subunit
MPKAALDFEKPIIELQSKLEELKKHPEAHSIDVNFEDEIRQIEQKGLRKLRHPTRAKLLRVYLSH